MSSVIGMPTPHGRGGWDVHSHLIPEGVVTAARDGRYGMEVVDDAMVGRAFRAPLKKIVRPAALIDWVETNSLDGTFFSPPPPLFRPDLSNGERRRWVGLVNDGLEAIRHEHGSALQPMAYLPAEDPHLAARVAEGLPEAFAGVTIGTDLAGRSYSDPGYDRLWAVLTERGLPAFLHPGECPDDRLEGFYLWNLLGNPYETTVAAAHLIFGGVLDRFPNLRLILAHGGGAVASLIGRWHRGHDTSRPGVQPLARSPLEAVRLLYVDSLTHSAATVALLVDTFGENRILFGSDWPFPMGADTARPIPGADADLENRILTGNPEFVFSCNR